MTSYILSFNVICPHVGTIKGSHIMWAKRPTSKYTPIDEFYQLNFYSTLLQGSCDHQCKCLQICVNVVGGVHDDASHLNF